MTDTVIALYLKSIWEHGYRLRNYHASGNWLIMEMAGLSHIGMLYPFLNKSAEWADYAFTKLAGEIDVQVYPDGFQYELSTNYHNVVVQNYHWVMCTAEAIGYAVPDVLRDNLLRMFELNIKITCPDKKFPDLNDGGRADLRFWSNMGKKYFPENAQISYFATGGEEGTLPDYTSVALPYAGQAYMRTGWGKDDFWVFMDAGPFGKAHQHEDKLNVQMYAYGKFLLPDSGNYAYDNSEMRKFVLSSYSHNVGLIDGEGQSRRAGYKWEADMINQRSDMKWSFTGAIDAVEGIYNEGYGVAKIPVTHKRKTVFFKNGLSGSKPFAVLIDRYISGDGKDHEYASSFQLDARAYTENGNVFTQDHGDGVTLSLVSSAQRRVLVAQKTPYFIGWRKRGGANSEDFEHYHAPAVQFVANGKEKRIVTVLYPSDGGEVAVTEVIASDDVNDTSITLVINGSSVKIDENDYPCSSDANEKLTV
jgi:hypothetical protein